MGARGLGSRSIIGEFYARLEQAVGTGWVPQISMMFTSDQESEEYKWLGQSPKMREWVGERQAKGFRENGIIVKNKLYEATMQVLVEEIRRDKTGQVMVRIGEMVTRANAHYNSLLSTLILNAPSTVGYDNQFFFDTDHSEGDSGTQDNDITVDISAIPANVHGSITAPSEEEMQHAIMQGIQAILGFKDDQGEPMNELARQFIVMVPNALLQPTLAATQNPIIGAGRTNTLVQSVYSVMPVSNARLTWTDSFAVFRADGNVKPFIRQEETGVMVAALAEGSEEEFKNYRHLYGITASRNVAYGYWQQSCYVTMI